MPKRKDSNASTLPAATARGRGIIESYSLSDCPAPLKVDQEAGIIYGVKVVGRKSKNNHGRPGVTEGTEYTPEAFRNAIPLYEGVSVYTNHPSIQDRARGNNRDVRESIGVIRNPRMDGSDDIRGDLYYKKSHSFTPEIVEDVQRSLGTMALSHNAMPGRERVSNGKLIIESIESVNSVDLVDKGGTNTNLWESESPMKIKSFKSILESFVSNKTKGHKALAKRVMEMDDTPADVPSEETASPEDQIASGFKAAIMAIIDGEGDAKTKAKKIKQYLQAHEDLTSDKEPKDDPASDDSDTSSDSNTDDSKKTSESLKREIATLKSKEACRELCESEDVKPSAVLLKSLMLLESVEDRKALLAESKATRPVVKKPTSSSPAPKAVTEGKEPKNKNEFVNSIRD